MDEFKKGDLVRLKSGGPVMTVYEVLRGNVSCTWFDKNDEQQYSKFSNETIEKVEK
ncbi:MAG: DUF2158 domain-containing protein [Xanthomarina gelatinilytica]|uniref:DUF2158 domain-containing protein n=1 Tax=Xanthomarina gelatinilytica TaxID=1137281 RepID=UPI003A895BF3